jgi:hypothetical protein
MRGGQEAMRQPAGAARRQEGGLTKGQEGGMTTGNSTITQLELRLNQKEDDEER